MKHLFFIFICYAAQLNAGWIRTYGGIADDGGNSIQQTTDSNYIFAGYTTSFGAGPCDVYLLKIKFTGDTIWTKTYGDGAGAGRSVQQTTDGGFIILGGKGSADSTKIWLIKTDANGDTLWTKAHNGIRDSWNLNLIRQTMDGGYIIIGEAGYYKSNFTDIWLIKTDSIGDTMWTKIFTGNGYDWGNCVQQTTDSGYIITGEAGTGKTAAWDLCLIKTDSKGDTLWTKIYGGPTTDGGHSVQQTTDGGYIVTGYVDTSTAGTEIWLLKTDSTGDTLWTKIFGNPSPGTGEEGFSVQQTADGGYIIAGVIDIGSNNDIWLIKTDSTGDTLWTRTYSGCAWRPTVQQTFDGGYILATVTESSAGDKDIYVIKTDSLGYTIAVEESSANPQPLTPNLRAFPNPFTTSTTIQFSVSRMDFQAPISLEIFDLSGKLVNVIRVNPLASPKLCGGCQLVSIGKNLKNGIYFVKVGNSQPIKITKIK